MSGLDRRALLDAALELAREAEGEILPRFRRARVETKADGSIVTDADRAAEERLRSALAERFPGHAILGEELGGEARPVAGLQWILDPIDGTASFARGVPVFGTLIGLLEDGVPIVGVVHFPALGETTFAARGLGCWLRTAAGVARRIRTEPVGRLDRACVSLSGVHASDLRCEADQRAWPLSALLRAAGDVALYNDCLQHVLVCRGAVHVAVDPVMAPWDVAALVPCVEEAGGVATSMDGGREDVVFSGSLLSSSDADLHARVVATLAGA